MSSNDVRGFQTSPEQRDELAQRFFAAAHGGDLAGLEASLARDVVLTGDGGGMVPALARSPRGRGRVARMIIEWVTHITRVAGVSIRPVEVNAGPGWLVLDPRQRLLGLWTLEIARGEILGVRSVVNPDKLAHLGPTGDFAAVPRSAYGSQGKVVDNHPRRLQGAVAKPLVETPSARHSRTGDELAVCASRNRNLAEPAARRGG